MNRRSFLGTAAIAGTQSLVGKRTSGLSFALRGDLEGQAGETLQSARRIGRATMAALSMQRRDWEQDILAQALLQSGQRDKLILLTKAGMVQQTADGRMGVVVSGGPTDPAMGGAAYAQAAEWTGDARLLEAVQRMLAWILVKAPRNSDGVLYHTFDGPQMWSDGINGAPPFLAATGRYDEAMHQIEGYRKLLFNSEKKLMAHIWDDGKRLFIDPNFWGGGNGWTAAGLACVIRRLPSSRHNDRSHLAEFARQVIDGCLAHQRADGLFHNVIDHPDTFIETNLAQMLAFAVYQGITDEWLPASYRASAEKMRTAARLKMDAYGFVQGACSAPDFDRPGTSTEAQAFCILMESAGTR
jgi:unsaturated rhamnogalacturonyl hydrolase